MVCFENYREAILQMAPSVKCMAASVVTTVVTMATSIFRGRETELTTHQHGEVANTTSTENMYRKGEKNTMKKK